MDAGQLPPDRFDPDRVDPTAVDEHPGFAVPAGWVAASAGPDRAGRVVTLLRSTDAAVVFTDPASAAADRPADQPGVDLVDDAAALILLGWAHTAEVAAGTTADPADAVPVGSVTLTGGWDVTLLDLPAGRVVVVTGDDLVVLIAEGIADAVTAAVAAAVADDTDLDPAALAP